MTREHIDGDGRAEYEKDVINYNFFNWYISQLKRGTIEDYYNNIIEGDTFCKSKYDEKIVVKKAINESNTTIWVVTYCEKGIKNWFLCEITFDGKYFVHTNKHSFFKEDGAEKYYTLAQGKEWTGGDVEDDFC